MEQIVFNIVYLHEVDPRVKAQKFKACNDRRQQRLLRSVEKFLLLSTPVTIVGPVVRQIVTLLARILWKRTNKCSNFVGDPEFVTLSLYEDYGFQSNGRKKASAVRCLSAQHSPA